MVSLEWMPGRRRSRNLMRTSPLAPLAVFRAWLTCGCCSPAMQRLHLAQHIRTCSSMPSTQPSQTCVARCAPWPVPPLPHSPLAEAAGVDQERFDDHECPEAQPQSDDRLCRLAATDRPRAGTVQRACVVHVCCPRWCMQCQQVANAVPINIVFRPWPRLVRSIVCARVRTPTLRTSWRPPSL